MSLVAKFDDLMRRYKVLLEDDFEQNIYELVRSLYEWWKNLSDSEAEIIRLQGELTNVSKDNELLKLKLKSARQMLDQEVAIRKAVESEKNDMDRNIAIVTELFSRGKINESREKLLSMPYCRRSTRDALSPAVPSTIQEEPDTIGSILNVSDMELTETEDDFENMFEVSKTRSGRPYTAKRKTASMDSSRSKKARSYCNLEDKENNANAINVPPKSPENKKKQAPAVPSAPPLSDDNVEIKGKALTSFPSNVYFTPQRHHQQYSPITPRNQMGTPFSNGMIYGSGGHSPVPKTCSSSKLNQRPHCFTSKAFYWTVFCQACEKRLKFGKAAYKCRDCKASCHPECKDKLPLPCVPSIATPGLKAPGAAIADFTPPVAPMVPALVVHCTNEVEARGLTEVGIYRIPGSDREVKELKERFLKGKGVPNLSGVDIFVVSCVLKSFLRSLKEPLIPISLWRDFVAAAEKKEQNDSLALLYQAISDLPQPNRDTLAWLICHLQKVGRCVECKMPPSNLAKVFGPTVVGNSIVNPQPMDVLQETKLQQNVMELLLDVSSDYWNRFLEVEEQSIVGRNGLFSPDSNIGRDIHRHPGRRSIVTTGTLPARESVNYRNG